MSLMDKRTSIFFITLEVVIIVLFIALAKYDREADPKLLKPNHLLSNMYPMFQDIHVMIFVGFGFLMTFLRKYGFSAVGFNFLLAATIVQWGLLCEGVAGGHVNIGIKSLVEADILAAAVLISMGAVLGKTTPVQLTLMALAEAVVYSANEQLQKHFQIVDVGGSMLVHVFGAYFGLAVSKALGKPNNTDHEGSSSTSDLFAMIGTLFLWLFWPSFNGALSDSDEGQRRAVINTYLSIAASCVMAFAVSSLSHKTNKFDMVHIQNATLAGGVAVGTAADLVIQPYGALIIGSLAGILSTLGYAYLQPFLDKKLDLHDTCGVHNLHGMPGVFAGLVGAVAAAVASPDTYGNRLYLMFPARAPVAFSPELVQLQAKSLGVVAGEGRSAGEQAGYQIVALVTTLLIALVSGAITGLLLRWLSPWTGKVDGEENFSDRQHWHVPGSEEEETKREDAKPEEEGHVNNAFV